MSNTSAALRARDPTLATSEESQMTFTASEARSNFMEVISRVRYGRERLMITNKGKCAAAIVTVEDLELLRLLDDVDIKELLHVNRKEYETHPEEILDWEEFKRRRAER